MGNRGFFCYTIVTNAGLIRRLTRWRGGFHDSKKTTPRQPGAARGSEVFAAERDGDSTDWSDMTKKKNEFRANDYVVYPAHGVGRIVSIEEQEIAGLTLELFVISFEKEKMTLRVPTAKASSIAWFRSSR